MSGLFCDCYSLKSLPDISKWNIENVISMKYIFDGCYSLNLLPDISLWDTSKIIDMKYMFSGCSSLISLPDISKWKINKKTYITDLFYGCSSLLILPDISKWNIDNINIDLLFKNNNVDSTPSLENILSISELTISSKDLITISSSNSSINNNCNNKSFSEIDNDFLFEKQNEDLGEYYDNFYY